jgi:hypothetical protein
LTQSETSTPSCRQTSANAVVLRPTSPAASESSSVPRLAESSRKKEVRMSEEQSERPELTEEELEKQEGEPLPEREQMSVVNPGRSAYPIPEPLPPV